MKQNVILKGGIGFFLLTVVSLAQLQAQNNHKKSNDVERLLIDSVPRGAFVKLSGKYSFMGRTPFVIPYRLYGKYNVKAKKDGYEGVSSDVELAKRGANRITIRLSKKTPFKASYRSLLLPGWGQFYGQSKFKGFFISLTQLSLGVVTAVAVQDYARQKEEYELALNNFESVRFNLEEARLAHAIAKREFEDAEDALNFRNTMIYVTAGFYIYNFLDSLLFFSSGKRPDNKLLRNPYLGGEITHNKVMLSMKVAL